MKPANISLHIEELVLHGFAPGDRYTIADAVETELSHLLAQHFGSNSIAGIPLALSSNATHAQLDAGAFPVSPGSRADSVGSQIAQALHGGLAK